MKLQLRARSVIQALSSALLGDLDAVLATVNQKWAVNHDAETGEHAGLTFSDALATQTTVGAAGSASALPANPTGYFTVTIEGTEVVVPYYTKS